MRLFEDLTFREIRGHQIKYDFALEKTGLETRPTYTCCNVRDNLLSEKDPATIRFEWGPAPATEQARGIRAPELGSIQEEHNIVSLGGDGLYCMYRTDRGHSAHAYSDDGGKSWSLPVPATYPPDGQRQIKQPRAMPRVWRASNGNYLLWFHLNAS